MIIAFIKCLRDYEHEVSYLIEADIGIDGPDRLHLDWTTYLESLNHTDFLSVFSVLANCLQTERTSPFSDPPRVRVEQLHRSLERIFAEEKVLLTLGKDLIIHPIVDDAFELQRVALIRGIKGGDYEAARKHLADTGEAYVAKPSDGAAAIRSVFLLAENIFKQMFARETSLKSSAAKVELSKVIAKIYPSRSQDRRIAEKQLLGFLKWIEGAHFCRHDPGRSEVSQPTDEISVLAVSEGFAFCRWLADLKRLNSRQHTNAHTP